MDVLIGGTVFVAIGCTRGCPLRPCDDQQSKYVRRHHHSVCEPQIITPRGRKDSVLNLGMLQTPVSLDQLNNYHTHAECQKGDVDRLLE